MKIVIPTVQLLSITHEADELIEEAGRTCYKSEGKIAEGTAAPFCVSLMTRGHMSVLEHASATFRFVCDRGVTHELVRHRIASYSQESTRYCNYGKTSNEITVVQPPGLTTHDMFAAWARACEQAERSYLSLIADGCPPQIARSVLPTCLKTEIVTTANFREWKHIFALRTSPKAHPQIKEIMDLAQIALHAHYPMIFPIQ